MEFLIENWDTIAIGVAGILTGADTLLGIIIPNKYAPYRSRIVKIINWLDEK